jgi:hypothetical protein
MLLSEKTILKLEVKLSLIFYQKNLQFRKTKKISMTKIIKLKSQSTQYRNHKLKPKSDYLVQSMFL